MTWLVLSMMLPLPNVRLTAEPLTVMNSTWLTLSSAPVLVLLPVKTSTSRAPAPPMTTSSLLSAVPKETVSFSEPRLMLSLPP